MPELTIEQTNLLSQIQKAKAERATVKARVEAENRKRLEEATRDAEALLNRRVREAFEAGISKRRIGREGLGTVDPTIVNRTLEKTAGEAAVAAAIGAVSAPLPIRELTMLQVSERGWADPDADIYVELNYPGFPTRWPASGDPYPNPLTGALKRVFGLWTILDDPSGFLGWELDETQYTDNVLPRLLDAYAAKVFA